MDAAFATWPDGHECFLPSADHNQTRGFVYACECGRNYLYRGNLWDRNRNDQWVILNDNPVQHGPTGMRPSVDPMGARSAWGRLVAAVGNVWARTFRRRL